MTPAELKSARRQLGLSTAGLARVVGVEAARTVRRWEDGTRDIPGPVIVILDLALTIPAVRRRLDIKLQSPRAKPLPSAPNPPASSR